MSTPLNLPSPFDWSNPIGRIQYFSYSVLLLVPFVAVLVMIEPERLEYMSDLTSASVALTLLYVILLAQSLSARRLVDVGKSRWWLLAQLVPLANFYLTFILLFSRGKHANLGAA